jgi:type I restriction enzyme R subunit
MVVANKFQTGYSQPLLAAMFLDKTVTGRNAIQTVSRLNRSCAGKSAVLVVDFTNNALDILKAFRSYRSGGAAEPKEPEASDCTDIYHELLARGTFTTGDVNEFELVSEPRGNPRCQSFVQQYRSRFIAHFVDQKERRELVGLMAKFVERFTFLSCFFDFPEAIRRSANFAGYVGPQLLKVSTSSEFAAQMSRIRGERASVRENGKIEMPTGMGRQGPRRGGGTGSPPPLVTISELLQELKARFPISDEEALCIREVTEEKLADEAIASEVAANKENQVFLDTQYKSEVNGEIQVAYTERGKLQELADLKYIGSGGIFDFMAFTVIDYFLYKAAS